MKHQNRKPDIDSDAWRCCDAFLRSAFCPLCGKSRPHVDEVREGELLAENLEAEASAHYKAAETLEAKIEGIGHDYDLSEPQAKFGCGDGPTWGDHVRMLQGTVDSRKRRADKASYRAKIVRRLLSRVKA